MKLRLHAAYFTDFYQKGGKHPIEWQSSSVIASFNRSYGNAHNAFVDALMQSSELVAECKKSHKKIPFELAGKAIRAVVELLSDEDIGKAFKTVGVHYRQREDWR